MKHLAIFIVNSFILLLLYGCSNISQTEAPLSNAENLIESHPDSAYFILLSLDKSALKNKKERAKFSLLMSIALDKNFIDTTNFDVLHDALEYYSYAGTPDEKLKTLYYEGRIFMNRGDDDNAMTSFLKALDLKNITDSLSLARVLVAQGTLYYKQYKLNYFADNNLKVAKIYKNLGKNKLALKSYAKVLDASLMMGDKENAEKIIDSCLEYIKNYPEDYQYILSPILSYNIKYGSEKDLAAVLGNIDANTSLSPDLLLNVAGAYNRIGNYSSALSITEEIESDNNFNYLKLLLTESDAYEGLGNTHEALRCLRQYIEKIDSVNNYLFTHDLLFSEQKYNLEMSNLNELHKKNMIIWISIFSIAILIVLSSIIYLRYRLGVVKRKLIEQTNENLAKEKEQLELRAKNYNLQLKKKELEVENLKLEKSKLKEEYLQLENLLKQGKDLEASIKNVIKERLEMLNSVLAKDITNREAYGEPYRKWIEKIKNNKADFMKSTRIAFTASHPNFIKYLVDHDLTENEINYVCLYAIGLRGTDVGEYIHLKRHYNISTIIRKKLAIEDHDSNMRLHIKNLLLKLG